MTWCDLSDIESAIKMPQGYRLTLLTSKDLQSFIATLEDWYPDIRIGSESRFLDAKFYDTHVFLPGKLPRDQVFLPIVFRHEQSGDWAGCIFLEKNNAALTITSPMSAIATKHRKTGTGLSFLPPRVLIESGKILGMELAYYVSTLRSRSNQNIAEATGFRLVGILPGNDRDQITSGLSKRVFEAIYAKPLIPLCQLFIPSEETLTETTQKLWRIIFDDIPLR